MRRSSLFLLAIIASLFSFAQEKSTNVDINVTKEGDSFWSSPWVWVVGAAVFILLLVALLRGGGNKK